MDYGKRYIYYATQFLALIILLAVFTGLGYVIQGPNVPPVSGNVNYTVTTWQTNITPQLVMATALNGTFAPLSDLNVDSFIPVLNQSSNGSTVVDALKSVLAENASEIAPVPYWEAEDLAQFLNASFKGYKVLDAYSVPVLPYENQSWTRNDIAINVTEFNVTMYNESYTPSTNVSYSLNINTQYIPQYICYYTPGPNGTLYVNVIVNCIEEATVVLTIHGYTYNGSIPLTWLNENGNYRVLKHGDGPYNITLTYFMTGKSGHPYNEFIEVFTNDTLVMSMRYGDISVARNYTGLIAWINATPVVTPNWSGGTNYFLQFSTDVRTFPVPDYVVRHPPPSSVFKHNYAFEYLEWAEYKDLAGALYNYSWQFVNNVTKFNGTNVTQYWRAEAYAIANELLAQNIHNISASYQHAYPIQALWDGNGTQRGTDLNLALILEDLMPVNVTVGQHYNVTSFYPVEGYWVDNWSYVYVNVQCIPPLWQNDTVFLQYNYTYLADPAGTYKYFALWQVPNGTYNNVTLYNPLPTSIVFHYGTYYLNITPIEFYNVSAVLTLSYNASAEYRYL
jgi:hypothetical protein